MPSMLGVAEDVSDAFPDILHHRIKFHSWYCGGGYYCNMKYPIEGTIKGIIDGIRRLEGMGYEVHTWSLGTLDEDAPSFISIVDSTPVLEFWFIPAPPRG